jgi:hypothetical protein
LEAQLTRRNLKRRNPQVNKIIKRARTADVAFTYRMPAGIPGAVNRASTATVEAQQLDTTNYPTVYGVPIVIDAASHNARYAKTGDASIYGMYVRPYPTGGSATDGLGTSTPPTSGIVSVLKRGYMTVKLNVGTAVNNGQVYVRITANGGNTIIGGIEATSDTTYTLAIANCAFMGPADASGNVEIAYNI